MSDIFLQSTEFKLNTVLWTRSTKQLFDFWLVPSDHIPQDKEEKRCIKCEKVFKTKYGLTLHLKEHFDEK